MGASFAIFLALSILGKIDPLDSEYISDTLIFVVIFAMLSVSLSLEFGFTGLVNFGVAGFFLIGAYSVAISMNYYSSYFAWTGNAVVGAFIFGLIVGTLICVVVGASLTAVGARLREDYFGILTLVFAEILRRSIYYAPNTPPFGGSFGLNALPTIFPLSIWLNPVYYSDGILIIASAAFIGIYFFTWRIVNSPFGRAMRSIRDDELASSSVGKNTLWFKIQVMIIGSAISTIPGALFGAWVQSVNPQDFLPAITFEVFIICIMGGSGNLKGALLGSGLYFLIARVSDLYKGVFGFTEIQAANIQFMITGALLILFVMLRPQGIIREEKIKGGKVSAR